MKIDWLYESYKSNQFLPCEDYLAIDDHVAEEKYQFNMKQTIVNGERARASGGVLGGYFVYIHGDVGAISIEDLKVLLKACGATVFSTQTSIRNCGDASKLLIITKDIGRVKSSKLQQAIQYGATAIDLTDLLDVFTNQSLESVQENLAMSPKNSRAARTPLQSVGKSKTPGSSSKQTKARLSSSPCSVKKAAKATVRNFGFNAEFGEVKNVIDAASTSSSHTVSPNSFETPKKKTSTSLVMIKLYSTVLKHSPVRSLSNPNIGDPDRGNLGAGGTFEIYKCVETNQVIVQYLDSAGGKMFEAEAPPPSESHKQLFGNAGRDICFVWDAYNKVFTSGGTTIEGASSSDATGCRRFFFWFRSMEEHVGIILIAQS